MQIPTIQTAKLPPTLTLTQVADRSVSINWQAGQILHGEVLATTKNNTTFLMIAGNRVLAQTDLLLNAGQQLKMEVVANQQPPILKILDLVSGNNLSIQAMRTALPKQLGLTALLANLGVLNQGGSGVLPQQMPQLAQLANTILGQLGSPAQLATPEGVKAALLNSGLLLENKLAHNPVPTALAQDFKAGLLKLYRSLINVQTNPTPNLLEIPGKLPAMTSEIAKPPLPGTTPTAQPAAQPNLGQAPNSSAAIETLLRQVEGALARIQLTQLSSAAGETPTNNIWMAELPVNAQGRTDLFGLQIRKDGGGANAKRPDVWSVMLAFDLPALGAVHARISYSRGQISALFWAEQGATRELFSRHMQALRDRLDEAGIKVGFLDIGEGRPKFTEDIEIPRGLIDLEA